MYGFMGLAARSIAFAAAGQCLVSTYLYDFMQPLYSIGHGSRPEAVFLALLQEYGITCLADVRSHPQSRFHPQYNRKSLETSLQALHIAYVFLGDTLGGRPKAPACYDAEGKIDYRSVARTGFFRKGMEGLLALQQAEERVAIMCSERDPKACHRYRLIGPALLQEGISLHHIDEHGKICTQEALQGEEGLSLF